MPVRRRSFKRVVHMVRDPFRRHWRRALIWRDRLKLSEEAFHLLLAGLVGAIGGLTYIGFDVTTTLLQSLMTTETGNVLKITRDMEPWQKLVIPTAGGLMAGLILYGGLRLIGSPGLSNLLEVVVAGDGRIRLRTSLTNAFSSLISLSSGASVGREGLLIQVSSALASKLGVLAGWPPYRLRLLVACGAASGLSASLNAPIAGAVFAAQLVLGNFSMNLFGPVVFASVVATMIARRFAGVEQHFIVNISMQFERLFQLPWFLLLGVVAGLIGALFLKSLRLSGRLAAKTRIPLYIRISLAGFLVGLIAIWFPEVWGNGYAATNEILKFQEGSKTLPLLLLGLLAAKYVATVICIGSGTVGGVFSPTLFLGAAIGAGIGSSLHQMGWALDIPLVAFALVGMGSLLAATTHSALLAMILIFELSLSYQMMPALMLACATSMIVARSFEQESIYTEPLRRKGLNLKGESSHIGAATEKTVADLMRDPVGPLKENTTFRAIAKMFLTGANNYLPVVNADQRIVGLVSIHDMKEYLNAGHELDSVIAMDIMRPPPQALTPTQKLADALPILLSSDLKNVPVVNDQEQQHLIGSVNRTEALSLLSEVIAARTAPRL